MNFAYALEPLGSPRGATATFSGDFSDVDTHAFTRYFTWSALEPDGRMTGIFALAWPNGQFRTGVQGEGEFTMTPASGAPMASVTLPPLPPARSAEPPAEPAARPEKPPFDKYLPLGRFPIAGRVAYEFDAASFAFTDSWIATPSTYVSFTGSSAGVDTHLPFHVTSHDWQASSRLLSAILTQVTSRTGAIEVGGRGTFDGVMTGSFRSPRIEGKFAGERIRAWDVTWGPATGDLVIADRYVTITKGVIGDPASAATILADGKFSLGYPRNDTGDEIDAHIRVQGWPLEDIRHAFGQDDWPVDGTVGLADLQLKGRYEGPFGAGKLRIDEGVAWGERFTSATGDLVFEGTGLRIRSIELAKGAGAITGTALIGWDNTYSFTVTGERIGIESLDRFSFPTAPLTGVLRFTAKGTGTFDAPSYTFDGFIADLYAKDEGIGQVRGRLVVRGDLMTIEQLTVQDPRLSLTGGGTITLDDRSTANLRFSFLNSSLDPYLKFYAPKMSPYTRIIASGSVAINGPLTDRTQLKVDAVVDETTVTLLDYNLKNDGEVRLFFVGNAFRIDQFHLAGQDTKLDISGGIDAGEERINLVVTGEANLAILQLFSRELAAKGAATVAARLDGPLDAIALTGEAKVVNGSLKLHALPHSLTDINGPITMDGASIHVEGLRGRLGEGDVVFGGSITLRGYVPEAFQLTATGTTMHLRYPPGLQSTVNTNLQLIGPVDAPRLTGDVEVLQASYRGQVEGEGLLALATGRGEVGAAALSPPPTAPASGFPLTLDIRINTPAPVTFIERSNATIDGRANLRITGTIDRPELLGDVSIERAEINIGGNRYTVRHGSIEFLNRTRIDPVFDVELETRPRSGSQVFTVTLRINGTFGKFAMSAESDPYLSQTEILSLLLGAPPDVTNVESQLRSPQAAQERLVQLAAAQIIASPITSRVGSVFERGFPVIDTFQFAPLLDAEFGQRLNPSARVTLGSRISSRLYLTYSRTVGADQAELILIEYEQNDRVSWVLSRNNEDRTFALDFRVRYVF
jgi:autotransporter translocation and assembly factor TamB